MSKLLKKYINGLLKLKIYVELLYQILSIESLKFSYFIVYFNFVKIKINLFSSVKKTKLTIRIIYLCLF